MANANDLARALSFAGGETTKPKTVKGYFRKEERSLDVPAQSLSIWDSVPMVQGALAQLEDGDFRSAALLCDALGRDDRVTATLDARINGVLSLPLDFEAGIEDNERAAAVAEEIKASWTSMFPEDVVAKLLQWGRLIGVAPGELVWKTEDTAKGKRWMPTMTVWHPQNLFWNWAWRDYAIVTQGDGIQKMGDAPGQWFLYTPKGRYLAWYAGLIRALAIIYLIRWWAYRDWARYSEKHGLPIVKAKVPKEADEEIKETYFESLAALGTENTIKCEVGNKDEASFDAELIEPVANTWAGFQGLIQQCDSSIAIVVLGQNLTTEVKQGSRAAAGVHERVRADFLRSDAVTLATFLRDQVLKPYAAFNYGDAELAPWPRWQTDPPTDVKDNAAAALSLGQAINQFKTASAPVNERELLEQSGVPTYSEDEWKTVKAERQKEAQEALKAQQDAAAGNESDDTDPNAPPAAAKPPKKKPGKKNAPNVEAEEPEETKAVLSREIMDALRALPITGWDEETVLARAKVLSVLGTPLERPTAKKKPDSIPEGQLAAQIFADDLTDDAAQAGNKAFGPDLAGVLDDIAGAKDYEDLRGLLKKRLGGMDRQDVATIVERATLLAHSAGRLGVIEATQEKN